MQFGVLFCRFFRSIWFYFSGLFAAEDLLGFDSCIGVSLQKRVPVALRDFLWFWMVCLEESGVRHRVKMEWMQQTNGPEGHSVGGLGPSGVRHT